MFAALDVSVTPTYAESMASDRAALWRKRDYMLLWSGQAVSVVGFFIQDIALPLLVLALTHSPAQAGVVAALDTLPFLILGLPAGALVDRWDRKRVMMVCDAGRAIAAGSIPVALWTGHLGMPQIYLVAAISGILAPFFNSAETASLPNVVSKQQLSAAMGQNFATQSAAALVGPPLGGLLFGIGHAFPFLGNAVSYVASVISLRFVRSAFQGERSTASRDLRAEILEGLQWMWRHPLIRSLAFMNGTGNLVLVGSSLVLIVLARGQHAPPFAIGTIFGIEAIGGIAGSLVSERIHRRFTLGQITLAMVWITALLFPLYAVAPNPVALGVIGAAISFLYPIYAVIQLSHRASIVPNELLGRVTSCVRLITVGAFPVGSILAGILLQTIGPKSTVLVFTAVLLAVALAATASGSIRRARWTEDSRAA